jgi:hypothetical protein
MKKLSALTLLVLCGAVGRAGDTKPGAVWVDPATGLAWTGHDNGSNVDWNEAKSYCRALNLGAHQDWRLPTIDELHAIFDASASDTLIFNTVPYKYRIKGGLILTGFTYWSVTQEPSEPAAAWLFDFIDGMDGTRISSRVGDRSNTRALCVRGSSK